MNTSDTTEHSLTIKPSLQQNKGHSSLISSTAIKGGGEIPWGRKTWKLPWKYEDVDERADRYHDMTNIAIYWRCCSVVAHTSRQEAKKTQTAQHWNHKQKLNVWSTPELQDVTMWPPSLRLGQRGGSVLVSASQQRMLLLMTWQWENTGAELQCEGLHGQLLSLSQWGDGFQRSLQVLLSLWTAVLWWEERWMDGYDGWGQQADDDGVRPWWNVFTGEQKHLSTVKGRSSRGVPQAKWVYYKKQNLFNIVDDKSNVQQNEKVYNLIMPMWTRVCLQRNQRGSRGGKKRRAWVDDQRVSRWVSLRNSRCQIRFGGNFLTRLYRILHPPPTGVEKKQKRTTEVKVQATEGRKQGCVWYWKVKTSSCTILPTPVSDGICSSKEPLHSSGPPSLRLSAVSTVKSWNVSGRSQLSKWTYGRTQPGWVATSSQADWERTNNHLLQQSTSLTNKRRERYCRRSNCFPVWKETEPKEP